MRNLHVLWPKPKKDKPPPLVRDIVKLYVDKVMKESSTSEDIQTYRRRMCESISRVIEMLTI